MSAARSANASASELLNCYRLPPIHQSHSIVRTEAWELLADVDALQAELAGSLMWERGREAASRRAEVRRVCATMAARSGELGLDRLSVRLAHLAASLVET
jgi:hypothetical protein